MADDIDGSKSQSENDEMILSTKNSLYENFNKLRATGRLQTLSLENFSFSLDNSLDNPSQG